MSAFADPHAALRNPTNSIVITPAFVSELAAEARTNNPAVRAADAGVSAALAGEEAIRRWEDPMGKVGVVGAEKRMREDDGDIIFGLEQRLPLFGKYEAARELAKAETAVAKTQLEQNFQVLRKDIAKNVFRIGYAERVLEIGKQDLQWLEAMETIVLQRYEIGDASQVDVTLLQNARSKRVTQLRTDDDNLAHERVILNKWLARDLHSPWPAMQLPAVAEPILFSMKLVNLALNSEPQLKTQRAEIKAAQSTVEITRRARRPDVSVGGEVRHFSESGEVREGMVALSFSIPWGNRKKYDADVRRDREKLRAKEFELENYALIVRDEVFHLTVQIDAARREALLYRDQIIPRSELALESSRIAWESNRGMFRDILEGRRMLLEARLMYARAVSEQYEMMSELVLCCGLGDLEALQMIGAIPDDENLQPK